MDSLLWPMNLLRAARSKAASGILLTRPGAIYDSRVWAGGMQRNEFGGVVEKFRAPDV